MSTARIVIELDVPENILNLLERLVEVLERDYDQRYGDDDDED